MLTRLPLLLLTLLAPIAAQSKGQIDFERQVFPILERNCIECHRQTYTDANGRKRRPKGRVMFDTLANIKSSKKNTLFVPKKLDKSLVIDSITLPADDEDRMPPAKQGAPLSKTNIETIKKWIEQGANYGTWTGEPEEDKPKAKSKAKAKPKSSTKRSKPIKKGPSPIVTLSKDLRPIAPATLASFSDSLFQVQSVGDKNPLLYVSCCGKTDDVDDAALAALAPIADHIFELDLARSQVSDRCCATLAKMKRLTKLDLRQTKVGNAGVKDLGACKELRSLNLYGTGTGDYALNALASLKKLERIYLYETKATARAVLRLREAIPGVRIVTSLDLPEPMETPEKSNRRRR